MCCFTHTPHIHTHTITSKVHHIQYAKFCPGLCGPIKSTFLKHIFFTFNRKVFGCWFFEGFFFGGGGGGQTRSKFIFNRRISNWFPCYKQKPLIKIKLTPCQCHISRSLLLLPASVTSVPGVKGHRRTSLQSSFPQVATQHDHQN